LLRAESAFRANAALAGPTESITLRDSRHGTDVWPRRQSLTVSALRTAKDRS